MLQSGEEKSGTDQSGEEIPGKEPPPEYWEELNRRVEAFRSKRAELAQAIGDQRITYIKYLNHENRTKAARDAFYAKRLEVRKLLDELYLLAVDVARVGFEEEAATYVITMLQNRERHNYYDLPTLEGAALMMDGGSRLTYVFRIAARSAVVVGNFDFAKQCFEFLGEEQMEEIDETLLFHLERYRESYEREAEIRKRDEEEDRLPRVKLETTQGDVVVELFLDQAPTTVSNFIRLVESGFYDGNDFLQVIDNLLALTGDPSGTGAGNSGKFIVDEHARADARGAFRGSLVMAKLPQGESGAFLPNSASSQFAILYLPMISVSEEQTVFGRVIEGMDAISYLRRVDPSKKKEKNDVQLPPDRILKATVIRRPEVLPEPEYFDPLTELGR